MRTCAVLPLLAIIFCGCSTTVVTPYPKDWPSIETMALVNCPNIEGSYYLKSENAIQGANIAQEVYLDGLLFGKYLDYGQSIPIAVLEQNTVENMVTLSLLKVAPRTNPDYTDLKGEFSCKDGWIIVGTKNNWSNEGNSHHESSVVRLKVMTDGSLLAHRRRINTNRALVFFYREDIETWLMFKPFSSEPHEKAKGSPISHPRQ